MMLYLAHIHPPHQLVSQFRYVLLKGAESLQIDRHLENPLELPEIRTEVNAAILQETAMLYMF